MCFAGLWFFLQETLKVRCLIHKVCHNIFALDNQDVAINQEGTFQMLCLTSICAA